MISVIVRVSPLITDISLYSFLPTVPFLDCTGFTPNLKGLTRIYFPNKDDDISDCMGFTPNHRYITFSRFPNKDEMLMIVRVSPLILGISLNSYLPTV